MFLRLRDKKIIDIWPQTIPIGVLLNLYRTSLFITLKIF